ncbi:hypothetical protein [Helcococcus kunzii]
MKYEQEKGSKNYVTNEQFRTFINLIIQILKDDNVQEHTIKKIENLLDK